MKIAFSFENAIDNQYGLELQHLLGLPGLLATDKANYSHLLTLDEHGLSLQSIQPGRGEKQRGATRVDFLDSALNYRLSTSGKQQGLAKAVGLNKHAPMNVLDATAGLGRDAYILASMGCRLTMLEQSPLIYALLQDGIKRALLSEQIQVQEALQRIELHHTKAQDWFTDIQAGNKPRPDVVYLDPMFPSRSKSAQVKKDISLLQELLAPETELETLLMQAKECAKHRVVLKRPGSKVETNGIKPSFIVPGKSAHFEIYV